MHLHLFVLLLSSGVSSYLLPLKEMPHLLKEMKCSLIDEMLCLLEADDKPIKAKFSRPLCIKDRHCAHNNTETFIHELKKIPTWMCMSKVEKGMQKLEQTCYILKKSSFHGKKCSKTTGASFSRFKESLQGFLRWVNAELDCSSIQLHSGTRESGLYLTTQADGKCSCHEPWRSQRGWGQGGAARAGRDAAVTKQSLGSLIKIF